MDCAPASNPQDAVQDLLPEGPLPYLGVLEISQDLLPDMEFIECPTAKESEPLSQEYFDELLSEVSSEDSSLLGDISDADLELSEPEGASPKRRCLDYGDELSYASDSSSWSTHTPFACDSSMSSDFSSSQPSPYPSSVYTPPSPGGHDSESEHLLYQSGLPNRLGTPPIETIDLDGVEETREQPEEPEMKEEKAPNCDAFVQEIHPLPDPTDNLIHYPLLHDLIEKMTLRVLELEADYRFVYRCAAKREIVKDEDPDAGALAGLSLTPIPSELPSFESDPFVIEVSRCNMNISQVSPDPRQQLKFVPECMPEAVSSAYFPLPANAKRPQWTHKPDRVTTGMLPFTSAVNAFKWNPGYAGEKSLGRAAFSPAPESCVGVVPTVSGHNSNDLIFFSWSSTNVWPKGIGKKSHLGRRIKSLQRHPAALRDKRAKVPLVCGGTSRLTGAGSIDGVLWTNSHELLVYGSDAHCSRLQRCIVDWAQPQVTTVRSASYLLPTNAHIREIGKTLSDGLYLSGHDDGSVYLFSWETLSRERASSSVVRPGYSNGMIRPSFSPLSSGNGFSLRSAASGSSGLSITSLSRITTTKPEFTARAFTASPLTGTSKPQPQGAHWKFDSPVGSVRSRTPFTHSVTLDAGQFHLLDARQSSIASSILNVGAPTFAHDFGSTENEVLIGDCHGFLHFFDLRKPDTPQKRLCDHSQGVIGDIQYNQKTKNLLVTGSPSMSLWHKNKLIGWTMIDDNLILPADHVTHATHVPDTTLIVGTSSAGTIALYEA